MHAKKAKMLGWGLGDGAVVGTVLFIAYGW